MWGVLKCFGNKKHSVGRNSFCQRIVSIDNSDKRTPIISLFISQYISLLSDWYSNAKTHANN